VLTGMWSPATEQEKALVIIGFVALLVLITTLTYLQAINFSLKVYWPKIRLLISPWLVVALACVGTVLSLFFNTDLILISSMATLFSVAVTFYTEKVKLPKKPKKRTKVMLSEPYDRFKPYLRKRDGK
jgi:hypothetical protein